MPDLWTMGLLATLMREPLTTDEESLARLLATTRIRNAVGATRYDALTDLSPFLPIALDLGQRIVLGLVRSESSDDYRVSYADSAKDLTAGEKAEVRRLAGGRGSAFSITPAMPTMCRTAADEAELAYLRAGGPAQGSSYVSREP